MESSSHLPEIRVFSPINSSIVGEMQMDVRETDDDGSRQEFVSDMSSPSGMGPWKRTFDMRMVNLSNFPLNSSAHKLNYRTHNSLMTRAKSSVISSPIKSLNALRAVLQKSINKEIDSIVQSYLEKFFKPAIYSLKKNTGDNNCISEHHLQSVCRTMLEEAKKLYFTGVLTGSQRCNSPFNNIIHNPEQNICSEIENSPSQSVSRKRNRPDYPDNDCESGNESSNTLIPTGNSTATSPLVMKIKKKVIKRKKMKVSPTSSNHSHKSSSRGGTGHRVRQIDPADGIDRSGPRWDPSRLSVDTKFVLGSKANKALGFGALRGRLYTKHPNLFRYIGDGEDKVWLSERGLMPPAGGRAYLLVKEDIEQLLESQYEGVQGVSAKAMGQGFVIPQFMIDKMKKLMENLSSASVSKKKSNVRESDAKLDTMTDSRCSSSLMDQPSPQMIMSNIASPAASFQCSVSPGMVASPETGNDDPGSLDV